MLPAHQFRHAHLIAVCLQLQAAQHVGDLAAELTRMQRVTPHFRERLAERLALVATQHARHFGLTTRHHDDMARVLLEREAQRVVGGGIAGVQRRDDIDRRRQLHRRDRVGHREIQKRHPLEAEPRRQFLRALHELVARLDTKDARVVAQTLEEQVVQNESQVGLARTVIDERDVAAILLEVVEQRLDELEQVIDLLQLAAAVLVHLAVARQDMELLQELDRLIRTDFVGLAGHRDKKR
ncbi:hypothetical protein PT2222_210054 [Paraburkholderia tropica]